MLINWKVGLVLAFPLLPLATLSLQADPLPEAPLASRTLAILDPVDLHTQKPDPDWGEFLRRNFTTNPKWKVVSRDTLLSKFKDYKIDVHAPCH